MPAKNKKKTGGRSRTLEDGGQIRLPTQPGANKSVSELRAHLLKQSDMRRFLDRPMESPQKKQKRAVAMRVPMAGDTEGLLDAGGPAFKAQIPLDRVLLGCGFHHG